jgi:hypothetical protein
LSVVCIVLSGRGLCDELITRPNESYRLWHVVVCDQETFDEEAIARAGLQSQRKYLYMYVLEDNTRINVEKFYALPTLFMCFVRSSAGYKGPVFNAQVHRDGKGSNPMPIKQSIN